jgi:hypothetical protein
MTSESIWHNTGGNGFAKEVWVRRVGNRSVELRVMPGAVVAKYFVGKTDVTSSVEALWPVFNDIFQARYYANRWFSQESS